jgi:hypothetical protein
MGLPKETPHQQKEKIQMNELFEMKPFEGEENIIVNNNKKNMKLTNWFIKK